MEETAMENGGMEEMETEIGKRNGRIAKYAIATAK